MESNRTGSWMVWLNEAGYIQVHCSECQTRLSSDDEIPDICPVCGSRNAPKATLAEAIRERVHKLLYGW